MITYLASKYLIKPAVLKGYQMYANKSSIKGYPLAYGEMHPIVTDEQGQQWRPSYEGPGTNYEERVKRGFKPINDVDAVAMKHDSQYSRAKHEKDPKKKMAIINKADMDMINTLKANPQWSNQAGYAIGLQGIEFKHNVLENIPLVRNLLGGHRGQGKLDIQPKPTKVVRRKKIYIK